MRYADMRSSGRQVFLLFHSSLNKKARGELFRRGLAMPLRRRT